MVDELVRDSPQGQGVEQEGKEKEGAADETPEGAAQNVSQPPKP